MNGCPMPGARKVKSKNIEFQNDCIQLFKLNKTWYFLVFIDNIFKIQQLATNYLGMY